MAIRGRRSHQRVDRSGMSANSRPPADCRGNSRPGTGRTPRIHLPAPVHSRGDGDRANRTGSGAQPLPTALGTLDAIHLATAQIWRETTSTTLTMATHDATLATAARALGMPTVGGSTASRDSQRVERPRGRRRGRRPVGRDRKRNRIRIRSRPAVMLARICGPGVGRRRPSRRQGETAWKTPQPAPHRNRKPESRDSMRIA